MSGSRVIWTGSVYGYDGMFRVVACDCGLCASQWVEAPGGSVGWTVLGVTTEAADAVIEQMERERNGK